MSNRLSWLQRIVSGGLLSYLLIFVIDISEIQSIISKANFIWGIIAYMFLTLSVVVSVFRWRSILKYDGINVRKLTLLKIYYIGHFYNMILPGALGGDTVKAYKTANQGTDSGKLAASVPMERLGGLLAIVIMLMVGGFIAPISIRLRLILFSLSTVIICICMILATEYGKQIGRYVASLNPIVSRGWSKHIIDMFDTFSNLRQYDFVAIILAYSIIYFSISLLTLHSIGRAFGVDLPIPFLIAIIPVVRLSNQLPISMGGLGVRESMFVYFFSMINISSELSITIGLANYSLVAINGLIGGLFEME